VGCCTDRALLAYHLTPLSYLAHYSVLKMEENCFSETSVNIRRTIRRHIPLHNMKSYRINKQAVGRDSSLYIVPMDDREIDA
jgi:hypothetical protein